MESAKSMTELIERLKREAGCEYISDLHQARFAADVFRAVNAVPAEEYGDSDWEDALNYISGGAAKRAETGCARGALLNFLAEQVKK